MVRQNPIWACMLMVLVLTAESGSLAGECRLFKRKPIELGRNLTEKESKLFEDFWEEAQRYKYFEETLGIKDLPESGCGGETQKRKKQIDRNSAEYQRAVASRKQELRTLFMQYLAMRELYDSKKGSKSETSVLKRWALVRFKLELCLSSLSDVIREIERSLGVNSDIFAKVGFIENMNTGELIPHIQMPGSSRFSVR